MACIIVRRRKLGKGSTRGIVSFAQSPLQVHRSWIDQYPENIETAIRWGCTANIPCRNVINTAEAIHQVNDKLGFRRLLNEAELCPKTWFSLEEWLDDPVEVTRALLRPQSHSRGRNIVELNLRDINLHDTVNSLPAIYRNYYISEYIPKIAEYRVFVAQGRAVWVAKKTPGNPDDVAWNVARGGRFDNVRWDDWPLKAVKNAIQAFNLSSLDFGGVDVMQDAAGNCYTLEINSAPSLTSPYRQEATAKALDYMLMNGKQRIPLIEQRGGYKKFISPAVCSEAQVP